MTINIVAPKTPEFVCTPISKLPIGRFFIWKCQSTSPVGSIYSVGIKVSDAQWLSLCDSRLRPCDNGDVFWLKSPTEFEAMVK